VTLSWLAALILFPEAWQDQHGYNQLGALILTSGLHWVACLPLAIASSVGVLRPALPVLVAGAPFWHLAGSSINAPGCWPFFVVPSMAILIAGFMEARLALATVPPMTTIGPEHSEVAAAPAVTPSNSP
jgi:hypothetical protein